jgi:hypothetical protein
MHHSYFDPDKLTDEQRARWDWAIAEYQVILNRNVERQIGRMSVQDKENLLHSFPMFRMGAESLDDDVRKVLHLFHSLSGGAMGDPRSALFARLLLGKPPLERPPPSTFHHPWYEVIEDDGPFKVMVSDAHWQPPSVEHGEQAPLYSLCIDHCPWLVERMNAAAQRLFDLQAQLNTRERRRSGETCFDWTPELLAEVTGTLHDDPQFFVRFEEWPVYRLRLSPREATESDRPFSGELAPDALAHIENVLDTRALRIGYRPHAAVTEARGASRHTGLGWLLEKTW